MSTHATRNGIRPTPLRILTYLQRVGVPTHYRTIAQHLRHPKPQYIGTVCNVMSHDGRLRWVSEGTYTLPKESLPCTPAL